MGHPTEGRLLAHIDSELAPSESRDIQAHIDRCAACQAHLKELRGQSERVSSLLDELAPGPFDTPAHQRTLQTLKLTLDQRRKDSMLEKFRTSKNAQRTAVLIATALVVVGLLSLAPVRALASEFLGLFRVERFTVLDVDPARFEEVANVLDESMIGDTEIIEQMGEAYQVASLNDAAEAAGFVPATPGDYYGEPITIEVAEGGTTTFTPDVAALREVFEALDMDPGLMPESVDGQPFTIHVPNGVALAYTYDLDGEEVNFIVTQMPSPTVDVPDGVDVDALGEAMLQLFGMSPREARRLSQSIDWTTTLVLPIPTDMASVSEITVNGNTGLLFERADMSNDVDGEGGALLWQEGGMMYFIAGTNSSIALLDIADSMQ
jgi:hypothetical protein